MPIYEFYCQRCHRLFNFFSPRVDTTSRPPCPRCQETVLEKRPARFATLQGRGDPEEDSGPLATLGEERLEGMMDSLMAGLGDAAGGEDPRQVARLLRRVGEESGLTPGPRMEELLARLEAGESAESLDAELEGAFGDGAEPPEDLFLLKKRLAERAARRPTVDETLYFL